MSAIAVVAPPAPQAPVVWRALRPGLELTEIPLDAGEAGARLRLVVARLDPAAFELALHARTRRSTLGLLRGAWTIDSAPRAALALNAGQFSGGIPWGWVVRGGVETRPPGHGPLAAAVVVTRAGTLRLVPDDSVELVRHSGTVQAAFQSYPVLLARGELPAQLRAIDVEHRDARLALGVLPDGRVLVAMTRVVLPHAARALPAALTAAAEGVPLGLTIPELAAQMRALGCTSAVALDGGISAQLVVRDAAGHARAWRGWREVPLGLVAMSR